MKTDKKQLKESSVIEDSILSKQNQFQITEKKQKQFQSMDLQKVIKQFIDILKLKKINCSPQYVIQKLYSQYIKKQNNIKKRQLLQVKNKRLNPQKNFPLQCQKTVQQTHKPQSHIIGPIIDLSDQNQQKDTHEKGHQYNPRNQRVFILDDDQKSDEQMPKNNILNFPTKTIQNQTGRTFYLLQDPFVPKIYAQSLVQNYIEFRNKNFSDSMPVSKAQQRKGQKQPKDFQQKYKILNRTQYKDNSDRYKKQFPAIDMEFLWKNKIKRDENYLSSLSEVWTLEQSSMTKKKEMLKTFHEQRQIAKVLITHGYGIRAARLRLDSFYNKDKYHRACYTIVKQAFRCMEQDLREKFNKIENPFMFKNVKKMLGFLVNFHDSFKDEEMKDIFKRYIKIAYMIECEPPECQESIVLYKFILKDVLPQEEYDQRVICID